MSDLKKEQKYAWGKAPKAGKGVGRKPLNDAEKKQSVSISIRLPCEIVAEHGINGQWLWCAVMEKAKISHEERFKPFNNSKSDEENKRTELKDKLIDMLFMHDEEGEMISRDGMPPVIEILQQLEIL